ncbi:MAG: hypothetical protein NPIRA05_17520 [Nitrospirales bacterium]|nr:MAG: hypothetical protein NPIRA05_17520 [Nitrospirales bacterium]
MITTATQRIDVAKLLKRIGVRPPYFAIHDITFEPSGMLSACVPVQHYMEHEAGGISAAEAGRHLAILGLCSIALQRVEGTKHYYLAQRAHLTRHAAADVESVDGFRGLAWPIAIEKHHAVARTQMFIDSQHVLYDVTVQYAVVGERVFERMFRQYRQRAMIVREGDANPYARTLPLRDVTITGKRLTAFLRVESSGQCPGHFPHYPAIPVAILMQALSQAAAQLIQAMFGYSNFSYVISDADIRAEALAFLHEKVELIVDYLHGMDDLHILRCSAMTDSQKEVGHVELTVEQRFWSESGKVRSTGSDKGRYHLALKT